MGGLYKDHRYIQEQPSHVPRMKSQPVCFVRHQIWRGNSNINHYISTKTENRPTKNEKISDWHTFTRAYQKRRFASKQGGGGGRPMASSTAVNRTGWLTTRRGLGGEAPRPTQY